MRRGAVTPVLPRFEPSRAETASEPGGHGCSVDIKAEPADSYPSLRKQFLSLRSFANAKAKQASFYRAVSEGLFGSRLAGSESNLSSEREANQRLTNLLEASDKRCEQLLKEIEAMKSQQGNAYPEAHILVPEVPSDECLMSMSIRYDHGLAVPGYYDNDMFRKAGAPTHEQKLKSTHKGLP